MIFYTYCYHVAGAVGCMMAVVMGVSPDDEATLDRACDLGMAFQLANIARDVAEDDRVGGPPTFPPTGWPRWHISGRRAYEPVYPIGKSWRCLGSGWRIRAAAFEASARFGTPKLTFRSAWAVLAAAEIYGAIGREVRGAGRTGLG